MPANDAALASLLLTNRLVDTGARSLTASEFWPLIERVGDPATLLGRSAADLNSVVDGDEDRAARLAALLDAGSALALHLTRLEEQGIHAITPFDDAYPRALPQRLLKTAPPMLFCVGDLALLQADGIGVVGSRDVDAAGAEVATSTARVVADAGMHIVSGGARGVDQLSMRGAVEAGGRAVGVLAEALTKVLRDPETRRLTLDGRICLCTPYKPDAPFSPANAMARNKLIYALSRVTLVVASAEDSGGTWSGATEALKRQYGRVAVWRGRGEGAGNRRLEELGATPVRDVNEVISIEPASDPAAGSASAAQLSFDAPPQAEPEVPRPLNADASAINRELTEALLEAGRARGFQVKAEYPVPGGRIDVAWLLDPGPLPKAPGPLVVAAFEIESSWRTRKHIKRDVSNLEDSACGLGVIVLAGETKKDESLRRFTEELVARSRSRIVVWDQRDVESLRGERTSDDAGSETEERQTPSEDPAATSEPESKASPRVGKYAPLTAWLTTRDEPQLTVSFGEIERVLGFPLPASCRKHPAHWSGTRSSAVARALAAAGWKASRPDFNAETVVLTRT